MSAKYTIRQNGLRWTAGSERYVDTYEVLNPSGVEIASGCSWRVARKIADLYNADVELRRFHRSLGDQLMEALLASGAVSLQEEA